MEISVGFADKDELYYTGNGYCYDESVLGRLYYPAEGVEVCGQPAVRYMEYPWISTFETDGFAVKPPEECGGDPAGRQDFGNLE